MTTDYAALYQEEADETQAPTARTSEATIRMAFLDDEGAEQFSVVRTTVSPEKIQAQAALFRSAMNTYYQTLGCQLLSVQVSTENSSMLAGERPRPLLKLIQGGKRLSLTVVLLIGELSLGNLSALSSPPI